MNQRKGSGSVLDGVNRMTNIAGQNRIELLLFSLQGRQRYGINVFKVREVIRCPQLTHVPDAKSGVCGLANIRGQTITVIDLSAMTGSAPMAQRDDAFVVVAEYNRHTIGFLVADVHSIVSKTWEEIKPPPETLGDTGYLTAVTSIEDELVQILDVEHVLGDLVGVHYDSEFAEIGAAPKVVDAEVFIVDDSVVARKQLTRTMQEMGVRFRVATNGREALEMLRRMADESDQPLSARLAMVISDIEMPELDGYALTCEIREDTRLKDLYIVLHTSLSGTFNQAMAERVGADKLVPKFDPKELAALVRARLQDFKAAAAA